MLMNFLLGQRYVWLIPLILQALAYVGVLKKVGIPIWYAFIPAGADCQLSKKLFPKRRTFWRPFFVCTVLVLCAYYLNPFGGSSSTTARIFLIIAILIYDVFLLRLYLRLSKAFGHGIPFGLFTFFIPPLGLAILGLGKSTYQGDPTFKPAKDYGVALRNLARVGFVLISFVEVLAVVAIVGLFTLRAYPPEFVVDMASRDMHEKTEFIAGGDSIVTREDALGQEAVQAALPEPSRSKFFPSHAQDESVVVLMYCVGSDLEDRAGMASANIAQMIAASAKGSGLSFVVEAGGSKRWFTDGIPDSSYGRYLIKDGALHLIQELDADTCMSDPQTFADFLSWGIENYPADRRMLVFWDHGGGVSAGFGMDALNKRDASIPTLMLSEICDALKACGEKFDIIGFDACLMQDIEVAAALEPYADYLLASEETEGGYGWFYTTAFGKLAQNPSISSEEFGREIVACYDPYNMAIADGEVNSAATLSFVDLPLAKAAYENMDVLFDGAQKALVVDSGSFANLSLAATKSYTFANSEQVDLVDFLRRLDELDYEDKILQSEEIVRLENDVKSCVLYRNADSAEGIHGMALTFPVASDITFPYSYAELDKLSFDSQNKMLSNFFSIIAAQKKKEHDAFNPENATFSETLAHALYQDQTSEEWYVEGFENYDDTPALLNIPLIEVEGGYRIDAPDAVWKIIASEFLIAFQKDDEGLLRYLGTNDIGAYDEDGHPLVAMDGTWVHVGGNLCCYTAESSRETEKGTVFTGTTKARLNGTEDITLYIEWDAVGEDAEGLAQGRIVGYTLSSVEDALAQFSNFVSGASGGVSAGLGVDLGQDANLEANMESFLSRGKINLEPGDRVEFLFEYYDDQGNLVKTEPYGGALFVTGQEKIVVEDADLRDCDVEFGAVLTDVYQRTLSTERIEVHTD